MSYFAVVKAVDGKSLEVRHCHINFWSLPGLTRRKMYFDVGIHLVATEDGLKKVDIVVPFVAEALSDLSGTLYDPVTSQLIFRRESINGKLFFGDVENLDIWALNEEECKRGPNRRSDRSLWHVSFPDLRKDDQRYIRLRLAIRDCARMWNVKRHIFLKYGALLDFRVADTREAPGDPYWDGVRSRIVPLSDLQFFVIAPLTLQMQVASPQVSTSRILEGDSWESYLRRKTRGERLVIYQWNYGQTTPGQPIDTKRPYRVFLDLSRESLSVSVPANLQSTIVTLCLIGILVPVIWWIFAGLTPQRVGAVVLRVGIPLTATGIVSWIVAKMGAAKTFVATVGRVIQRLDDWRYRHD
jgi:hypothetical protein